jgi:hypothetical protein
MKAVSELKSILGVFFKNWNKARLDCFSKILTAILIVKTVNLSEIAVAFEGRAKKESRYQRIKNFLKVSSLISNSLPDLFFTCLFQKGQGFIWPSIEPTGTWVKRNTMYWC